MSGFWDAEDGEDIRENADGTYDTGGGNMDPIPDGTNVLAAADEIKWDENQGGAEYLSIRWSVQAPEDYANRKVFHKLWVSDDDPNAKDPAKKRDKAKRMLAAIDANAGGKLARKATRPNDDDLMLALSNKPMVLKLGLWEQNGSTGNWVIQVSPKAGWAEKAKAQPTAKPATKAKAAASTDLDDDVPF